MTTTEFAMFLVEKKVKNVEIYDEFKKMFEESDEGFLKKFSEVHGIDFGFLNKLSNQAKKNRFDVYINNLSCCFC